LIVSERKLDRRPVHARVRIANGREERF